MTASVSTPGIAAPASAAGTSGLAGAPSVTVHLAHGSAVPSRPLSQLGLNGNTLGGAANAGTWGGLGGATLGGGGRDPRGKARSRDYLKQCLQEITYLTSSTTLNPLGPTSYGAPSASRPRKVLPENLPPPAAAAEQAKASVPGLISLPGGLSGLATSSNSESPQPNPSAPAPVAPAAPQAKQLAEFKPAAGPAGDAASAFVPLKRTISQPGQQGARGRSERADVPAGGRTRGEAEADVEGGKEGGPAEGGAEAAKEAGAQAAETFAEVVRAEVARPVKEETGGEAKE